MGSLTVTGDVLLDARQHLADYRRLLHVHGGDANVALQVDALVLQLDDYHRSSTCDARAFTGISKDGKGGTRCLGIPEILHGRCASQSASCFLIKPMISQLLSIKALRELHQHLR